MSKYSIDSTTLSAIGNAIKAKKGDNTSILVSNFANEIANLSSGSSSCTSHLFIDTNSVLTNGYRNSNLETYINLNNIDKIQMLMWNSSYSHQMMMYIKDKHYDLRAENIPSNTQRSTNGVFLAGDFLQYDSAYGSAEMHEYTGTLGGYSGGIWIPYDNPTHVYEVTGYQNLGNRVYDSSWPRSNPSNTPLIIYLVMED